MNSDPLFLAIDQGGSSSRALVYDGRGNQICKAQRSVDVEHPRLGWVEQDATMLVESVTDVIQDVIRQLGTTQNQLRGAGLATQRSNIVCWRKSDGAVLSPAISWQDRRAYQWMDNFNVQSDMIRRNTGLRVSPHYGVSKIKWCLQNLPQVARAWEDNDLLCGPLASFLTYNLVEKPNAMVDPANASRTLLWNIDKGDWDDDLLTLFEIPRNILPCSTTTRNDFGNLSKITRKIPISVVTGDQSAAMFAYGNPETETLHINMGTGVFIQLPTHSDKIDIAGLLCSIIFKDGNGSDYVVEATINGAANALMEIEDVLGISGADAEVNLPRWAEKYTNPPLFLNGVAGLAAPYWIPDFISRFVGQGVPEEKVLAVAESILFLVRVNLELIKQRCNSISKVVVTGGLANSDMLCQKLANLISTPVFRPAEGEATARGLAFLVANRPVTWEPGKNGKWFNIQPEPALIARYQQWKSAMEEEINKYKPTSER